MKRVGGWLGASKHNASTQSLSALDEPAALENAMAAVLHILNDDVDTADRQLSQGNSPYHKLGKGVVAFLRAVLGFEPEAIRVASSALDDAEAAAHQNRHSHRNGFKSDIYPIGSEYALCQAQSQLMGAVVAVLSESLTESIRGFYRLRKAYITLQEIADAEKRFISSRRSANPAAAGSKQTLVNSASDLAGGSSHPGSDRKEPANVLGDDDEDLEFVDAAETPQVQTPLQYQGHLGTDDLSEKLDGLSMNAQSIVQEQAVKKPPEPLFADDPDYDELTKHPIDLFIHSGSNLCFGILQLLLSLVPPAFSKLLYIVGFKGDREEGVASLWRAIKYSHINGINGAMAGLVILGYYNGMVGFCDIVSAEAYPKDRCRALLTKMRTIYPGSNLWILHEAMMLSGDRRPEEAVQRLAVGDSTNKFKAVHALQWFEMSLNCMCMHRYQECADAFLKCVELNNWSHGLYYYIAGVCHVELYRQYKSSDPTRAAKHGTKATELLRKVPAHAAKKRLMARQLPFDAFVTRKIQKWEDRATQRHISFIDAVGVAPVEEMIYFWNAYKRMRSDHLEESLRVLAWNEDVNANPNWNAEPLDEKAILLFLRAVTVSRLGRIGESKEILEKGIVCHDWAEFKKGTYADNWTLPVSHYEMAVNIYIESGGESGSQAELKECSTWLEKAAKWESYDLDARVGLKITTARDTLRKCGVVA